MAPGGIPATYSVNQSPGVTYTWAVPSGAIGLTGQGTNTISFIYPNSFTSGTVSVTGTTGCGSATRSLSIGKLNPGTPSVIDVIQVHFCGEPGGRVYSYTLASMPSNTTSVLWTVPTSAGAVLLSGQGTASITVSYPDASVLGSVSAQAINNCGASTIRSTAVKLAACPLPEFTRSTHDNNNGQSKTTTQAIPFANAMMEVQVFPNPSISEFKLKVLTSATEEINVRVIDNRGRVSENVRLMPFQAASLGTGLKPGLYLVEIRQGNQVKTTKIIKL